MIRCSNAGDFDSIGNAYDSGCNLMNYNGYDAMNRSSAYDLNGMLTTNNNNAHDSDYTGNADDSVYSLMNCNACDSMSTGNAYDLTGMLKQ